MPRGRALKNPNGYGSVVKLSGKRRNPFEVRVNTRMDERYYPNRLSFIESINLAEQEEFETLYVKYMDFR